jgi:hypothetical protein
MQIGDAYERRGTCHASEKPESVKVSCVEPEAMKQMAHHHAAGDGTRDSEPNHRGPTRKPPSRQQSPNDLTGA